MKRESRDQGSWRAITAVSDHRCALCGIRMLTPEGHTAVDAAHIIPWRISHNDDPRNGLALCRLCHWTFDEGMLAVSTDYLVNASPRLRADTNLPAHLAALNGQGDDAPRRRRLLASGRISRLAHQQYFSPSITSYHNH